MRRSREKDFPMPYSYDPKERKLEVFYNLSRRQKADGWERAVSLPYTYYPDLKMLEVGCHLWMDDTEDAIAAGWHPAHLLPQYSTYR